VAAKDYISIVISVGALVVSTTTAYYANFLQVDELRALALVNPQPSYTDAYALPGHWQLVFINSGTRAVAVTYAAMAISDEFSGKGGRSCSSQGNDVFETDLAPLVIKEKEIISKEVKLKSNTISSENWMIRPDGNVSLPHEPTGLHRGDMCFIFALATPSDANAFGELSAVGYEYAPQGFTVSFAAKPKPTVIWHSTKFIFQTD
jgi:hypothetical protein